MGNGITKILPDLYLGNLKDARDRELLARHNITHILSIHDTASPVLEEMTYLCIPAADHSKQNLIQFFKESIEFIHESRLKGEGCLVHCKRVSLLQRAACEEESLTVGVCVLSVAGVSRSVTLVVAYIMTVTGRGWVQALGAVRAARPCAGPNLGFLRQLEEFQNTELAQYRAWWSERFGKSPFSDDDEIQNLLNHKSANGRSATDTATAADLGTAGT
ncbi:dual specificity protein phosphatase 22-B isoform X1 [Nothobranchius furzeri]|uniref:dual specificity protein phosphatase 22-B isoform X1 n=2 Tax=Nothobranchius furzeri TaxID=105023 RepID=UPI0024044752|nr:dual specificity protein phosphatase 22-B isoform X4 [Nothobranchius furzeri]